MQQNPFGVTRHGIPLAEYGLRHRVNTGIEIHNPIPWLVPEYEILEAIKGFGGNWDDLDYRERAALVAHYRVHLTVESHVQDAVSKASERQRRRRK